MVFYEIENVRMSSMQNNFQLWKKLFLNSW